MPTGFAGTRRRAPVVIGVTVAVCVAAACYSEPAPDPAVPPVAGFAGREVCTGCHEEQADRWGGSDHDLAMQIADAETVLGAFDGSEFTEFGVTSTFYRRDGRFFVRTEGADGALDEFEIAYTFGARPLQQYLIPFPHGRYQMLGIAWDARPAAAGGQRWFSLHPEARISADDAFHWTGRWQTWNAMCAACHSTGLRKGYDLETDRYETTWAEIDVSCEACHGPGSKHVAWAQSPDPRADAPGAALIPALGDTDGGYWQRLQGQRIARRSPPRSDWNEIQSCARCHSLRSALSAAHEHGESFRDGYRLAFMDERYHVDGQISDEVYVYGSFLQSKMHAAGVTCGDCHEPHSLQLHAEGNLLCARCHDPSAYDVQAHHLHAAGSEGALCVSCHMPETTYMVIDPRTDHRLRVPRPDLTVALGVPNPCTGCHPDRGAGWAVAQLEPRLALRAAEPGWAAAFTAARAHRPGAAAQLLELVAEGTSPPFIRASVLWSLRDLGPIQAGLAVIQEALAAPEADIRRGAASTLELLDPRARVALGARALRDPVRSVRNEAALALAAVEPALLTPATRDALARVTQEYEAAQRANADLPGGASQLALLQERTGRPEAAIRSYRRALDLDPGFMQAAANLADLYRALGREAEAENVLRDALTRTPRSAELHHALGLALVRASRMPEALPELMRAAELSPQAPRYSWVYAVALHDSGDLSGSLAVLAEATQQNPGVPELLALSASYSREAGDMVSADHYERALQATRRPSP